MKYFVLNNFIRKIHDLEPIKDFSRFQSSKQVNDIVYILTFMSGFPTNKYVFNRSYIEDPAEAILEWYLFLMFRWWPICECDYNFNTGSYKDNCSMDSVFNLLSDIKNLNLTISILKNETESSVEIIYVYDATESIPKRELIKAGSWDSFLNCGSKRDSLDVLHYITLKACNKLPSTLLT